MLSSINSKISGYVGDWERFSLISVLRQKEGAILSPTKEYDEACGKFTSREKWKCCASLRWSKSPQKFPTSEEKTPNFVFGQDKNKINIKSLSKTQFYSFKCRKVECHRIVCMLFFSL